MLLCRDEEMEVLRSLSSWNPGGGAYDNSTNRKTGKGKSIQKRQRPTEVNTVLAIAGGDSRVEIPTAPTKNPKSETMTSTLDDAELLKDLRGLGKPPLFNGNDIDASFSLYLDTIRSFCVTWMTWWIRVQMNTIGEMANPRNQHIEVPQIQYTDKVADESVAVQRHVSPRTTERQGTRIHWGSGRQVSVG